ncbi:MAG: hypothetical protein V9E94_13415 [Microthrixaceae bacterium]
MGQLGAVVVLHQGQRQVDPRGDAGRGPTVAVVHVDAVLGDAHRRVGRSARHRPPSASSPRSRRAGPAAASSRAPLQTDVVLDVPRRDPAELVDAARGPRRRPARRARRSTITVSTATVGQRGGGQVSQERHAAHGPDRAARREWRPPPRRRVGAQQGRGAEHVRGPRQVEQLVVVERDQRDAVGGVRSSSGHHHPGRPWRQ